MKKMIALSLVFLCAVGAKAAVGPAGDGILSCATADYKTVVEIDAQDGSGKASIRAVKAAAIEGVGATALIARTADGKNLIANVSKGGDMIQISASGFYTAYCSGCDGGQSLNYKKATLSQSKNGVLSIQAGFSCTLELPAE